MRFPIRVAGRKGGNAATPPVPVPNTTGAPKPPLRPPVAPANAMPAGGSPHNAPRSSAGDRVEAIPAPAWVKPPGQDENVAIVKRVKHQHARRSVCPECGDIYTWGGGGHCRGGKYGGCCQTFVNDTTGDEHRVGPHEPAGQRRCLTIEEMLDKGWRLTRTGWTLTPEATEEKRELLEWLKSRG